MTRLSICIPTYNFGAFIGETLDSITPNLRPGVEIVILDGGSTDDTAQVVAQRQQQYPQISYHKRPARGGIDRDIASVVDLSVGEYCWLFSADDIMRPGAIDKVLQATAAGNDICLCEHTLCDANLAPIADHPIFAETRAARVFDMRNAADRTEYFRDARTSEAFFSYLAGPIFRRSLWDAGAGIPESFYGTCWAHAGRLLSRFDHGISIGYMGERLIFKRSGVDSFMDRGLINRLRITIEGFAYIAESLFGVNSMEAFHMRRVTRGEAAFLFRRLISVKIIVAQTGQRGDSQAFDKLVRRHYSNAGIGNTAKYWLFKSFPVPLLTILKSIKDRLRGTQAAEA